MEEKVRELVLCETSGSRLIQREAIKAKTPTNTLASQLEPAWVAHRAVFKPQGLDNPSPREYASVIKLSVSAAS